MLQYISEQEFLDESKTYPILDVRSPKEFDNGHIPTAINMPLFSNEERACVGTLYKKEGKQKAILRGLDIVGPKMSFFVKFASKKSVNNIVLLHCWRGGMRSESLGWLLSQGGLNVKLLKGGYKAYKRHIRKNIASSSAQLIILGGKTGSGKTHILDDLKKQGEQVIQLEYLANHKGSVFGAMGQKTQPSTEQFENNLYKELTSLDKSKPIWVEDESMAIGKIFIPKPFFDLMRNSPLIFLEIEKEKRIKLLAKEYTDFSPHLLIQNIEKITKRLGNQNTKTAIEAITSKNYKTAIDIALTYYDKTYVFGMDRRDKQLVHILKPKQPNPNEIAKELIEYSKKLAD